MPVVINLSRLYPFYELTNIFLVCLGGKGTARFAGQAPAVPLHQCGGFPPVQARLNVQQFQAGGEPLYRALQRNFDLCIPRKGILRVPFST